MICFLYIFIDIYNEIYVFIPWYITGILIASYVIFENRRGNYMISSIVFLITANTIVYLFSAVDHPESGIFLFYTATSAAALVLFHRTNRGIGYFFVILSIGLAFTAYLGDWSPVERPQADPVVRQVNFLINFLLGLSSSVIILVFIIERNRESEKRLIGNQEKLESLTRELEQSKTRFESAVKGAGAGIYEWDIVNNSVYASPRWKELLGYGGEADLNIDLEFFMKLVHPEDAEMTGKSINDAIAVGGAYQSELRMRRQDGSYHWFSDTGIIIMEEGKPSKAVGSIIDINDRKLAEFELLDKNAELVKTNDELDRFVYSASHDMRAPLSTLLGLLEVASKSDNRVELDSYFELMRDRIYTMEGFIREITDYSRNARLDVDNRKQKLLPIVQETVKSFDFLANEAEIEISLDVDQDMIVNTDKNRLSVVLNNLVSNAIKYHDKDKTSRLVEIKAERINGQCEITIKDNGVGIDPIYKDKVFDMFFRASEKSKGSGLGLYIVKETIDKLGARVSFESELKQGSVFSVSIPSEK